MAWIATIAMLPSTAVAERQRATSKTEEIVGIVTQVSATSLTIRTATVDRDVHLTSATIVRADDQPSTIAAIAVGDKVDAYTQKETDGTSTALAIRVESHPSTELEGTVKSVTATTLTITTLTGDIAIALTADTRVLINGQTGSPSDIHPGDHVEVEIREQTDKTLTALVVKVQFDSVHIRGIISAASTTSITVKTTSGDVVVGVTTSTLIRMQGKVVNVSALVVGSRVEVEAVQKADKSLVAISIDVESPTSLAKVEGTVTAVAADHLTVHTKSGDNITVGVNADTIIRAHDQRIGLSDIKTGDHVYVDARVNADGTFTALRIEVQNQHDGGNDNHTVDLTGLIASISSGSISVTAGGKTVVVKISSTTIIRRGSTTLSPADLKVGNPVEVKGQLNTDGSVAATLIQVADTGTNHPPEPVSISGTVTAVSATSLTVTAEGHSVTVALTSSTVVKNGDHTGSLSDLKTGQHVEVTANRQTDGSLVATQVRIDGR
jgi:Cu/Ag efflux protein CusF